MESTHKQYPSIVQTIGLLLLLVALHILVQITNSLFLEKIFNKEFCDLFRSLISAIIILFFVYFMKRKRGGKQFYNPFKAVNRNIYLGVILVSPFYIFFTLGIVAFVSVFFVDLVPHPITSNSQGNIYSFISTVCLTPLFEELLFRGIILDSFLHRYSCFKAIMLSVLFFSSLHYGPQIASALILGLSTGMLYYYTRSILPGIVLHALNNLFAFVFICLSNQNPDSKKATDISSSFNVLLSSIGIWWILNAIVLGVLLYYFLKMLRCYKKLY